MNRYRPTTLRLASQHCPKAVDLYESPEQTAFREHFQVGIAAHECLANIGQWALDNEKRPRAEVIRQVADATMRKLMSEGRSFDGRPEPPMRGEDAIEGRDLAVSFALSDAAVWQVEHVWIEHGLGFDAKWRKVPYESKDARFRLVPDVLSLVFSGGEDGEEYESRLACVRDYKSAWTTSESELQSLQMKAQAVAACLTLMDVDGVRREIVNIRTGQVFREDIYFGSGGLEQLQQWQADITAQMDALDAMRGPQGRPARPGKGCLSCPWALSCSAAVGVENGEKVDYLLAARLGKLDGERSRIIEMLKASCAEQSISVNGELVGWHVTETKEPTKTAAADLFTLWQEANGDLPGFLAALQIGVTGIGSIAKVLHKGDKAAQQEAIKQHTQIKRGREFGIR